MISDTLFEAATRIEDYLNDPLYHHWYGSAGDPLYDRLRAVDAELRAIVRILDTPPDDNPIVIGASHE